MLAFPHHIIISSPPPLDDEDVVFAVVVVTDVGTTMPEYSRTRHESAMHVLVSATVPGSQPAHTIANYLTIIVEIALEHGKQRFVVVARMVRHRRIVVRRRRVIIVDGASPRGYDAARMGDDVSSGWRCAT
jgi:CRISPR/Cas system-associated endonuclease Cas3-HD